MIVLNDAKLSNGFAYGYGSSYGYGYPDNRKKRKLAKV
jgi:hypothetical protein